MALLVKSMEFATLIKITRGVIALKSEIFLRASIFSLQDKEKS